MQQVYTCTALEVDVGTDGNLRELFFSASNRSIAPSQCAAEGHAGAERVASTDGRFVAVNVSTSQLVFASQVGCANVVGTVVPSRANNPGRCIEANSAFCIFFIQVSCAEGELVPSNVCTNVPTFGFSCTSNCVVRRRVASANAQTEAREFAIPTSCDFPQVFSAGRA